MRFRAIMRSRLCVGILAALVQYCTPAMAQLSLIEVHRGGWTSGVGQDDVEFRFSAATFAMADGARMALAFDRFPGACDALVPSLTVELPYPASQSIGIMDGVGYMRVDRWPIRIMKFNARVSEGEAVILMQITRMLGKGNLASELRQGRALRFKLGTERTTYYLNFPLIGFTSAASRTFRLCHQHDRALRGSYPVHQPQPKGEEDSDYFED